MKTRIALFVAALCGAAVTWLNLVCVREVISKQQCEIRQQQRSLSETELDLRSVRTQLAETSVALHHSQDAEETARREIASLRIESAAESARVRNELNRVTNEFATQTSTITSEQTAKTARQIYELQNWVDVYKEENKILKATLQRIEREQPDVLYCPKVQPLPAELRGKVVACDPKWHFVVVNVGQEQGARSRGEFLVCRNGRLIGWLVISNVEKDRCIANVKQGWQLTEILEGDLVMPAHPES